MKKLIRNTVAILLFTLSGYASAAREITLQEAANLMPLGYISIDNLFSVDEVVNVLNAKSEKSMATKFRIISISGNNKLRGTAVIYR